MYREVWQQTANARETGKGKKPANQVWEPIGGMVERFIAPVLKTHFVYNKFLVRVSNSVNPERMQ
jgi:hypothetical protein